MRLSELPNRNPVEELRSHHRPDPYWDGMWDNSRAFWVEVGDQRRRIEAGLLTGSEHGSAWLRPPDTNDVLGAALPTHRGGRDQRVAGIAASVMWRTLLAEQVAAICGNPVWAATRPRPARDLYRAGIVDIGISPFGASQPILVRPNSNAPWRDVLGALTFDEKVGITAGMPLRWGSQHDRHNVLTTELALRAAEVLPVRLVAGEHLCSVPRMYGPGSGIDIPETAVNFAADAMLVRSDGLRIMVEMTASVGDLSRKLNRWGQVLASDSRTRHMAVVFVFAPHPDAPTRGDWDRLREQVRASAHRWTLEGVPERMFVAKWTDWFPARHEVSADWRSLAAECPTGVGVAGEIGSGWETRRLLDPFEVDGPKLDSDPLASNQQFLLGVPFWLRTGADENALRDLWLDATGRAPFPVSADTVRRRASTGSGTAPIERLTKSPDDARLVKQEYRAQRARWRLAMSDGSVSLDDVFRYSTTPAGAHFRRFRLSEVLGSQPEWTTSRARRVLSRFQRLVGVDLPDSSLTIGWLMSHRTGKADRWRSWWYAVGDPDAPWPGFPYLGPGSGPDDVFVS